MDRILTQEIKHGCGVFSSADNAIVIQKGSAMNEKTALTVSFYVKITKSLTDAEFLFGDNGPNPAGGSDGIALVVNTDLKLGVLCYETGGNARYIYTSQSLILNTWHYITIVATYDNIATYIDSVLNNNFTAVKFKVNNNGFRPFVIGGYYASNYLQYAFKCGMIDGVEYWNRALTLDEIKKNFNRVLKPQQGLVAYYKLDGNALDSSGNGNHGTVNGGVSWSNDVSPELEKTKLLSTNRKYARFSGVHPNHYADLNIEKLKIPYISVEVVFRSFSDSQQIVIGRGGEGGSSSNTWYVTTLSNRRLAFTSAALQDGTNYSATSPFFSYTLGQWTHLIGTYDGQTIKTFVNGVLVGSVPIVGSLSTTSIQGFFIGAYRASGTFTLNGEIDYARIYNRPLTDAEITSAYTGKAKHSGLIANFEFNGNYVDNTPNPLVLTPTTPAPVLGSEPDKILLSKSKQPYMVSFDKVDDAIQFQSTLSGSVTTVCAWVRLTSKSLYGAMLLSDGVANWWQLTTNSNTQFSLSDTSINLNVNLLDATWRHITITTDGTTARVYSNGILAGSAPFTKVIAEGLKTLLVGRHTTSSTFWNYGGDIADLRIYNRTLSQTECLDLTLGKTVSSVGLLHRYNPAITNPNLITGNDGSGTNASLLNGVRVLPSTAPVGQRSTLETSGALTNPAILTLPSFNNPFTQNGFTLMGWFNLLAYPVSPSRLFEIGTLDRTHELMAYFASDGSLLFMLEAADGTSVTTSAGFIPPLRKWQFLAFVFSPSSKTLQIYQNAILVKELTTTKAFADVTRDFAGVMRGNASGPTYGRVGGLSIFETGLTQPDIKKYMHIKIPASTPYLVDYWPINEGVGTTVYGTKGNNGTITGTATWTTPSLMNYVGKQVNFGTGGKHITIQPITIEKDFTVETWLKRPNSVSGVGSFILGKQGSTLYGSKIGFIGDDFFIRCDHGVQTNSIQKAIGFSSTLLNTYVHLAVIRKDGVVTTILNGATITTIGTVLGNNAWDRIGTDSSGNNNWWTGTLDDLRIWSYARTQTQIQENMNRTLGREPGLVLNMGFESDYYDASGYGNHGTPVGNPVIEVTDNDKLLLNAPIN